jgi:L-arabinonolactonase
MIPPGVICGLAGAAVGLIRSPLWPPQRRIDASGADWDPRDASLYWTDIEESRIYRLGPAGDVATFSLPERAAFLLPRAQAGFIVGFASRIAIADNKFRSFSDLVAVEPDLPQTRVNDATADPFGGIVFGTFDERDRKPVASLYRLAPNGELRQLFGGVTISNGLAFSPDGATMYFADTPVGEIRRFKVGKDFSSFDEIAPLAGPNIAPGNPDGAVIDQDGYYWSARVWGHCLVRVAPDGRLAERIDLPVRGPTCVALGGAGGRQLFATTLRVRHSDAELAAAPQAGSLFAANVAVPGEPQTLCLV